MQIITYDEDIVLPHGTITGHGTSVYTLLVLQCDLAKPEAPCHKGNIR